MDEDFGAVEHDEHIRVREIVADGVKTDFWNEVKVMLLDLQATAKEALLHADPNNPGVVAQYQQMYKIPDMLISIVEGLADEQAVIDEKLKEKFVKEVRNDSASER